MYSKGNVIVNIWLYYLYIAQTKSLILSSKDIKCIFKDKHMS